MDYPVVPFPIFGYDAPGRRTRGVCMWGSRIIRRIIGIATGALLIAGLMAPTVGAHERTFDSNVTIRLDGNVFKGAVGNPRAECQRGRTVTVFKIRRNGNLRRVGSDRTNANGNWFVPTEDPRPEGRFFARGRPESFGRYRHLHRCGGDRSVTINTRN